MKTQKKVLPIKEGACSFGTAGLKKIIKIRSQMMLNN
ncbi:hypothetical protein QFZ37_001415 [Chryseobacterium ginsenosidimutans]|nr:hypothetical protein [Chryseobacterium ginsenosidimutans]